MDMRIKIDLLRLKKINNERWEGSDFGKLTFKVMVGVE